MQEDAPSFENGKLVSSQSFFNLAENFFKLQNAEAPYKIGAILIDPGHGGKDPGASSSHVSDGKKVKVVEKDINLKVGHKQRVILKKAKP